MGKHHRAYAQGRHGTRHDKVLIPQRTNWSSVQCENVPTSKRKAQTGVFKLSRSWWEIDTSKDQWVHGLSASLTGF